METVTTLLAIAQARDHFQNFFVRDEPAAVAHLVAVDRLSQLRGGGRQAFVAVAELAAFDARNVARVTAAIHDRIRSAANPHAVRFIDGRCFRGSQRRKIAIGGVQFEAGHDPTHFAAKCVSLKAPDPRGALPANPRLPFPPRQTRTGKVIYQSSGCSDCSSRA
jgi:hypothetical protein